MRSDVRLNPEELRELAALDAALAGEPVDPALAELERLVTSLREERPVARREFAARLDARVQAGFAGGDAVTEESLPTRLLAALRRHGLAVPLALGSAASVFIVVVAVLSSGVFSGGNESGGGQERLRGAPTAAAPARTTTTQAAPEGDLKAPQLSPVPPRSGGVAPRRRERKQEHQASLVLAAATNDVENVADDVIEVTDRYRGFVLSSNVTGGEDGSAGAALDLRIPSNRLQPAIADISKLAHVRSRSQSTQDVTARYVSLRADLREALAVRQGLLRQLARADTPNETASIRARLALANRRIASVRSRLRAQHDRIDFAAVSVTVAADASANSGDGKWTIGDALRDAGHILAVAAGVIVIALAVALPIALVALVTWIGAQRAFRRRRERALDESAPFEKTAAQ